MSDYVITIDDQKFNFSNSISNKIQLNGINHNVNISQLSEYTFQLNIDNKVYHLTATKLESNKYSFLVDGHYFEIFIRSKLEEEAAKILSQNIVHSGITNIISPMPGLITKVYKGVGDKVKKDEPIFILEAMKMENAVKSQIEGVVTKILVNQNSSVEKNQILAVLN
jgi:biotin carboxyl carrier protein